MCTCYDKGDDGSKKCQNHGLSNLGFPERPVIQAHRELTLLLMEQKHSSQTQLMCLKPEKQIWTILKKHATRPTLQLTEQKRTLFTKQRPKISPS
jgi:hypothetical protein